MAYSFFLRGTKDVKKIYISITHGKDLKLIKPTEFKISETRWNKDNKRMKLSEEENKLKNSNPLKIQKQNEVANFNQRFSVFEASFNEYFSMLIDTDSLTETKLGEFFSTSASKNMVPTDFADFVDYYCLMNIGIADSTKKVYKRTRNLVSAFNPKLRIQDIDDRFKNDFGDYLDKRKYQRSYIRKSLGNIKDFWKYAKRKKIKVSDDPDYWELTKDFPNLNTTDPDDPYLTWEELEEIRKVQFDTDYLDNARDWLLISCWTAQRVSDLMEFTFEKIITDENNNKFLPITQEKTGSKITIPLFKEVEQILNKRGGNFPRKISHQKYNDYIKLVCEKAKITEMVYAPKYRQPVQVNNKTVYRKIIGYFPKHDVITSHVGRRTFVSLFINNVDLDSIRKITGHTREKMVEVYNKLNSLEMAEMTKAKFKNSGYE